MSSMNEFELLCVSEDVELGDTLEVEADDNTAELMIFKRILKGNVCLINRFGQSRRYSAQTLECLEESDNSYITGKSEEQLSTKSLMARG
jgi:hypothetical protein